MLREVRICDFAIIDELGLELRPGLNVITGETGAGKSILIRALGLICGERADPGDIRTGAESASIEAVFEVAGAGRLLAAAGVESGAEEEEILIRRVVTRSGRGRVLVNGVLATVSMLGTLAENLVHIYGQHEQSLLMRPASHLDLLDLFAGLGAVRSRMGETYERMRATRERLHELARNHDSLAARRESLQLAVEELASASIGEGEDQALRQEREVLRHAERLHRTCAEAEGFLYSGEQAVLGALRRHGNQLQGAARIDPRLASTAEMLENATVQLQEAARQLRTYGERVPFDPARLEAIDDRLALLSRLARKHGVTPAELPAHLDALRRELDALGSGTGSIGALQAELAERQEEALAVASDLSRARARASRELVRRMAGELESLGLGGAVFQVKQEKRGEGAEALAASGIDEVEFFLAANAGEAARPLSRVASGGELSRIMLALKALTASAAETPLLIFDEVDAGVGGNVADAVARRLKRLAATHQLVCITHLPQIAAHADHHLAVEKTTSKGRTVAHARPLAGEERVAEISRMLGGNLAPAEAERYARRLLHEAGAERTGQRLWEG